MIENQELLEKLFDFLKGYSPGSDSEFENGVLKVEIPKQEKLRVSRLIK
ncbi:MAG: hypothetical protein Q4P17_09530 [Methanobacterium sp.]|nr:hypothetical protein [Methanobacterium sp.]